MTSQTEQVANRLAHLSAEQTEAQIKKALEIASNSGFNTPADPAFVGAVLVALALNAHAIRTRN